MKKLKANQLGVWCTYCKTNRATHRSMYFRYYSCSNTECMDKAKSAEQSDQISESHLTEADYQTWSK